MPQKKKQLKGGNQLQRLNSVLPPPPPPSPKLQRVNSKEYKPQPQAKPFVPASLNGLPSLPGQRSLQPQSVSRSSMASTEGFPPIRGVQRQNSVNATAINVNAPSNVYLPFYENGTLYMFPKSAYPKPNSSNAITKFSGNGIEDYYIVSFKAAGDKGEGVPGTLDKITYVSKSRTNSISTPQIRDVNLSNGSIRPIATNAAISAIQNMVVENDGKVRFDIDKSKYNAEYAVNTKSFMEYKLKKHYEQEGANIFVFENNNELYEVVFADNSGPFQLKHYQKSGLFGLQKTEINDTKKKNFKNKPSENDFENGYVKSMLVLFNGDIQFIVKGSNEGGKRTIRKNALEARTVAELKERCVKRGIKVRAGMKKADLVAALRRR